MTEFPYLCFRHGDVNAEYVDKCEEVFLWFDRVLTLSDRKIIAASCPEPIAGDFTWGDRFVYFGSAGDTYDFDLPATYGPEWFREGLEADDHEIYERLGEALGDALDDFVPAVDAWLSEVHDLVGITFFSGLSVGSPESDWAQWSRRQADRARAVMDAFAEEQPWVLDPGADRELRVEPKKDGVAAPRVGRHLVESATRERVATIFAWIHNAVTAIELEHTPDEDRHDVVKSGEYDEALALLDAYIEGGGEPTPQMLTMFEHVVRQNDELLTDPMLIENVIAVLNENGRVEESIILCHDAVDAGMPWTARVVTRLAYSAFVADLESEWRQWVVDTVDQLKASDREMLDRHPWVYINLACVAAVDGRLDQAFDDIDYLLDYQPGFRNHVLAGDLAPLHDDPRWKRVVDG